jgi:hypothetical protein
MNGKKNLNKLSFLVQYGEPWDFAENLTVMMCKIVDTNKKVIDLRWYSPGNHADRERIMDLQRRIIACVNACAGIRTDELERLSPGDVRMLLIEREDKVA